MKMRRTAIIAFLLLACMVIGVGYAAITRDLFALANIQVAPSNLDVCFTAAVPDPETTDNLCLDARVVDETHVRMSTSKTTDGETVSNTMNTIGQKAVALFTITNKMTDTDVMVEYKQSSIDGALNSSYFEITREFLKVNEGDNVTFETAGGINTKVTKLPRETSVILKITIELKQTITDGTGGDQIEMTGTFLATSIDATSID